MKRMIKTCSLLFLIMLVIIPERNPSEVKVFTLTHTEPDSLEKSDNIEGGACTEDYDYKVNLNEEEWELIWNDEFNLHCLDSGKWNVEDWAALKNNELQYYTPNNVKTEEGLLKIISRKERYRGRDYTSGAIQTKDKFEFLYGKVVMRAKLPIGKGMFPAFWMITAHEDAWLPEIDIMEMLGHKPNEIWMVVHWLNQKGKLASSSSSFEGPNFSEGFHTFSIEWTPDYIAWYIDDVERYRTSVYVPNESMYLYLNTAIGGDWPGSPDLTTEFPTSFEIDYVRVYKKR